MNTLAPAPAPLKIRLPDFGKHPRRINLNRIETIRGLGKLRLRPIRPEDEPEMVRFHERISEESVYMRYFEYLNVDRRTTHERLIQVCANTPESYALVVERLLDGDRSSEIVAVGRLTRTVDPLAASFDTLIADDPHGRAIRHILLSRLVTFAHAFGFQVLLGELLVADHETLNACRRMGFSLQTLPEDGLVWVMIEL